MRAIAVSIAVVAASCGRFEFARVADGGSSVMDGDGCAGAYCDDFERTVPVASGDPLWLDVLCPTAAATLVVDHTLQVRLVDRMHKIFRCKLGCKAFVDFSKTRITGTLAIGL